MRRTHGGFVVSATNLVPNRSYCEVELKSVDVKRELLLMHVLR
jgi:hypothetical protein